MTGCAYPDLDPGRARTAFGLCQAASCACLAAPSSAGCVSTRTQARKHTHTKKHTQDERVCARERARARASASERGMRCRVTRARMAPGPLRTCTPCIWCGCEYIWLLPVLFRHDAPPGPPCSRACAPAQSCRARASSHAAPRSSWTPRPRAMRAIAGQPARAQMHAVAGTHMCCRGGERGRGAVSAPVGPGAVLVHPRPSAGLLPLLARTPEFQASEKKWSRHRARDQNDGPDRKDRPQLGTQAHPSAAGSGKTGRNLGRKPIHRLPGPGRAAQCRALCVSGAVRNFPAPRAFGEGPPNAAAVGAPRKGGSGTPPRRRGALRRTEPPASRSFDT